MAGKEGRRYWWFKRTGTGRRKTKKRDFGRGFHTDEVDRLRVSKKFKIQFVGANHSGRY